MYGNFPIVVAQSSKLEFFRVFQVTRKTPKGGLKLNTSKVAQQYRLNQWAQRIRDCRNSGQTVAVWCSEHNIRLSSYFYWLKRVREAACEALPSLNENNQIVPVNIPNLTTSTGAEDQGTSSYITVRMDAVVLEIHNNASQTLIENTLRALHNVR